MVRYYGALGPKSPVRGAVTAATRGGAVLEELEGGYSVTVAGKVEREARRALSAAGKAWAACLRKVFEVDAIRCEKCGGEMKLAAVIVEDAELDRILAHQGWSVEFPKTRASRAPPRREERCGGECQVDPRSERWEGRQEFGSEWPA